MVNGIRRDTVAKFWAPRGLVGLASVLAFLLSLLPIDALAREQRHARRRAQGPSSAPPAAVSRS
jgi:hypothetical protein